ncbi:MAG: acyloxyacyl hydrolase [Bdellovibrionales bacterium]
MRVMLSIVAALLIASATPAQAASNAQPNLLSFGLGYMNFNKSESHKQSADFRAEYRWGVSLLPKMSTWFSGWDRYVQLHPFVAGEVTSLGALYGLGGLAFDGYIGRHIIVTWSEGVGLFYRGNMAPLGSFVEFRSQIELGWRFKNEMRVTAQVSHISNAGLTRRNPGAEIAGVYFHVPIGR